MLKGLVRPLEGSHTTLMISSGGYHRMGVGGMGSRRNSSGIILLGHGNVTGDVTLRS